MESARKKNGQFSRFSSFLFSIAVDFLTIKKQFSDFSDNLLSQNANSSNILTGKVVCTD